MDAIQDSVTTHEDLHSFTLMQGEYAVDFLDLAGLENAPGLYIDVTQQCRVVFTNKKRLVFTNKKRLVFTQVNRNPPLFPPCGTVLPPLLPSISLP